MIYQINKIEELKSYFVDNNIIDSNDLGKLGLNYWNNELKSIINPNLFKEPSTKEELIKLIEDNYPLLLIDTFNISDFKNLVKNDDNLISKKYWENPLNYLGFWNTENIENISSCFYGQEYFNQQLYWNTSKVEDSSKFFFNCQTLNKPINLDLNNCLDISHMFFNCFQLNSKIKLNNINNIEKANSLFYNCKNLNQPIKFYLPNCKDISNMFHNCFELNSKIELKNICNVKNFYSLFANCKNMRFNNIKSIINQLIIKFKNISDLEKEIKYNIPEEYQNEIQNKLFGIVNQI